MTFGERLKQLRESAGLTQPELAERAGMNRFGVAKLEQGQREPAWGTILALCKALGVPLSAFEGAEAISAPEPQPRGRPRKAEAPEPVAPRAQGKGPPKGRKKK